MMWKDLRELLLVLVESSLLFNNNKKKSIKQKKNKKNETKQKKINLMTEILLPSNTSNRFKFLMTTCGKKLGLRRRNRTMTLPTGKSRTLDSRLL